MLQFQPRIPGIRQLNLWFPFVVLLLLACNILQGNPKSPPPSPVQTVNASPAVIPTPLATETSQAPSQATETMEINPPTPTGGQTIPLPPGQKLTITRIDMIDLQQGWGESVINETAWALLHTDDGGRTWVSANPPGGYPSGSRAFALDAQTLWAAPAQGNLETSLDYGYVYRTDDGGQTWRQSQPIPLATAEEALVESFLPSALFFRDSDNGWLVVSVGHYMNQDVIVIFSTQDGGMTWNRLTDKFQAGMDGTGAAMPCRVFDIAFVTPQTGWLAGNCTAVGVDERWKVLETSDGGKTWISKELPAPTNAPKVVLAPEAICAPEGVHTHPPTTVTLDFRCTVYDQAGNAPTFSFTYVSADGGRTWNGAEVTAASFPDGRHGTALGPLAQDGTRSLFVTANSGKTWNMVYPVAWPEAQLDFVDTVHGWAVVRRWNNEQNRYDYALVFTQDGGGVWEWIEPTLK